MHLSFIGKHGKVTLAVEAEPIQNVLRCCKWYSKNVNLHYLKRNGDNMPENSRVCAVSAKHASQWKGHFNSEVLDSDEMTSWRLSTPLERLFKLNKRLEVEDTSAAELLWTRVRCFGSNGYFDYALWEWRGKRCNVLGFPLELSEVEVALSDLFKALGLLHEMGLAHSNVSTDSVWFDCSRGLFVLSDMLCLSNLQENTPTDRYGYNVSYRWTANMAPRCQADALTTRNLMKVADRVAVRCVVAYMCTCLHVHSEQSSSVRHGPGLGVRIQASGGERSHRY